MVVLESPGKVLEFFIGIRVETLDLPALEGWKAELTLALVIPIHQCLNCEKLAGGELFDGRNPTKIVI